MVCKSHSYFYQTEMVKSNTSLRKRNKLILVAGVLPPDLVHAPEVPPPLAGNLAPVHIQIKAALALGLAALHTQVVKMPTSPSTVQSRLVLGRAALTHTLL